jgi:hypothetical protein
MCYNKRTCVLASAQLAVSRPITDLPFFRHTRIFNGVDGAPRIVTVIPLTEDASTKSTVASLADSLNLSGSECPDDGLWKMRCADLEKKT